MKSRLLLPALSLLPLLSHAGTFYSMGVLSGDVGSEPHDAANDGTVVGASVLPSFNRRPVRWTPTGGIQYLGMDSGFTSAIAYGVSADGSAIVGTEEGGSDPTTNGFRWTTTGGFSGFPIEILHGQHSRTELVSISSDGTWAGGSWTVPTSSSSFAESAAIFTLSGGETSINGLSGSSGNLIVALSSDGSTKIGAGFLSGGTYSFITSGGTAQNLGYLATSGLSCTATACSADGSIVVGYCNPTAFRWTSATGITALPDSSFALGISDDGTIIVGIDSGSVTTDNITYGDAAIWTDAGATEKNLGALLANAGVDMTGWHLDRASAISPDGNVIAGEGYRVNSNNIHTYDGGWVFIGLRSALGGGTSGGKVTYRNAKRQKVPLHGTRGITRSRINVASAKSAVAKVKASVLIRHSWRGDLRITLVSPDKKVGVFYVGDPEDGHKNINLTGTWSSYFKGSPASGTWTLVIADRYRPDKGKLIRWSLTL